MRCYTGSHWGSVQTKRDGLSQIPCRVGVRVDKVSRRLCRYSVCHLSLSCFELFFRGSCEVLPSARAAVTLCLLHDSEYIQIGFLKQQGR